MWNHNVRKWVLVLLNPCQCCCGHVSLGSTYAAVYVVLCFCCVFLGLVSTTVWLSHCAVLSDSQLWALTQYRVLQRCTLSVNESIECHSVIVLAEMINVELVTSGFRIMYMASPSVLGIFCWLRIISCNKFHHFCCFYSFIVFTVWKCWHRDNGDQASVMCVIYTLVTHTRARAVSI